MKITLVASPDGDYEANTVVVTRDGIEDLYQLTNFLDDAVRAIGFNYIEALGVSKGEGDEVWSTF